MPFCDRSCSTSCGSARATSAYRPCAGMESWARATFVTSMPHENPTSSILLIMVLSSCDSFRLRRADWPSREARVAAESAACCSGLPRNSSLLHSSRSTSRRPHTLEWDAEPSHGGHVAGTVRHERERQRLTRHRGRRRSECLVLHRLELLRGLIGELHLKCARSEERRVGK